jgi:hypothetical protein
MENNKRTFLNNMSVYNNKAAMDQMNQFINYMNSNSLFSENIQQTMNNFEQNKKKYIQTNFNNMTNILSLINLPIIVPYHAEHPLINCKTPGRISEKYNFWQCDSCKSQYSYDVPTFFCTACDFDICQKCILSLGAFWIIIYNYNLGNLSEAKIDEESSYTMKHLNKKIHHHPTIKIIREPSYYENKIRCNLCLKEIQKDENFYFCSLCNYSVCINCYNSKGQEKFVENPEYY